MSTHQCLHRIWCGTKHLLDKETSVTLCSFTLGSKINTFFYFLSLDTLTSYIKHTYLSDHGIQVPQLPHLWPPLRSSLPHLKRAHKVDNGEERQLLLKLASKWVFFRYEPCPVSGCTYMSSRCDKHLESSHPELSKEQLQRAVDTAQRRVTILQLAALRATAPHPPMVSQLDQEEDDSDVWSEEEAEAQASCQGCNTLQRKYDGVKQQLDNLRKTFRLYHRRVSRFERRTGKHFVLPPCSGGGGRASIPVSRSNAEPGRKFCCSWQTPFHPARWQTPFHSARCRRPSSVHVRPPPPALTSSSETSSPSSSPTTSPPSPPPLSPLSPPSPPPSRPSKTPRVSWESVSAGVGGQAGSVAPSSGRSEGGDSAPPAKRTRKVHHTGGSPSSPEANQEPLSPRELATTPRPSPASLLSGFSAAMDQYLDDYRCFLKGVQHTHKQVDNVASKVMRVRRFLNFMAVGALKVWDWTFLSRTQVIVEWVGHLRKCGKKVTTVTFYLRNIYSFMRYFKETPPPQCQLKSTQVTAVMRTILQCIRPLLRDVSVHQMKVKAAKQLRLIPASDLRLCCERCRQAIPGVLGKNR
nr:uncharacterized protein LOC107374514 [Nothobranchius furzeri]